MDQRLIYSGATSAQRPPGQAERQRAYSVCSRGPEAELRGRRGAWSAAPLSRLPLGRRPYHPHPAPERGGSGSFENPLTPAVTRLGEAASPGATLYARKPEAVPRLKAKGPFISRAPPSNWPFVHQCLMPGEGAGGTRQGPGAASRGVQRPGLGSGWGKKASHSSQGAPERAKDHAHVQRCSAGGWPPSVPAGSSQLRRPGASYCLHLHLHSEPKSFLRIPGISDLPSCLSQVPTLGDWGCVGLTSRRLSPCVEFVRPGLAAYHRETLEPPPRHKPGTVVRPAPRFAGWGD
nr:uncharacterized protein LOC123277966 [Equus asinus]